MDNIPQEILPWISLLAPLGAAGWIFAVARRRPRLAMGSALVAIALSAAASGLLLLGGENFLVSWKWLHLEGGWSLSLGLSIDLWSRGMLVVVTSIGFLVALYSVVYMGKDRSVGRYFASLSPFLFSMIGIVLADNLLLLFVFWELVGVSSYLLIGHWWEKPAAADAAKKAFLTNRVGDFGFMAGILLLWGMTGTIRLEALANQDFGQWPTLLVGIAGLLLFCGAVGKSAQFPLHVWLPDAMEGPTPVSALIHAATMVAAGVYLLVRVSFLLAQIAWVEMTIAWIGAITALLAALIATQQDDIKRILAYSTLSQLGYMVMAAGLGSDAAAMFHLFTHAFFKALLFLGAGAVIYACHHEQNIWRMGGLLKMMPLTFITFALGTGALTGVPYVLSGFYSKESILALCYAQSTPLFVIGIGTAFLTSFYMFRLLFVVFFFRPHTEHASRAQEVPLGMGVPLAILGAAAVVAGFQPFWSRFFDFSSLFDHHPPEVVLYSSIASFALGLVLAWMLYRRRDRDPILIPFLKNKFYFDELYARLIGVGQDGTARALSWFDRQGIDRGAVEGVSRLSAVSGYVMRLLATGNTQMTMFFFALGVMAILIYWIWGIA